MEADAEEEAGEESDREAQREARHISQTELTPLMRYREQANMNSGISTEYERYFVGMCCCLNTQMDEPELIESADICTWPFQEVASWFSGLRSLLST